MQSPSHLLFLALVPWKPVPSNHQSRKSSMRWSICLGKFPFSPGKLFRGRLAALDGPHIFPRGRGRRSRSAATLGSAAVPRARPLSSDARSAEQHVVIPNPPPTYSWRKAPAGEGGGDVVLGDSSSSLLPSVLSTPPGGLCRGWMVSVSSRA